MIHEWSYERHRRGFANDLVDPERKRIAASWFDLGNANAWRGERMYEIASILRGNGETWVTIGDGRFGLDAQRLKAHGASNVMATDLDESLLRQAKSQGLLANYRLENAERLSLPDASFDYAYCKESYHHFPRPAMALYEMLRVSRKGVILIEPNDRSASLARRFVALVKRFIRGSVHMDANAYEEAGNYVYSISAREIEKIALGVNLPQVAFKGLNDAYIPGLEFEPLASSAGRRMRRRIKFRDWLCHLGIDEPMLLMACLFVVPATGKQRADMERNGWRITDLPRNPHLVSHDTQG